LDLEKVEEGDTGDEVGVLEEEEEDGGGSDLEAQAGLRRPVFVLIVEQLFLIGEDYLVFKQDALIAAYL